ncbi:MAG: AAA ATPase [Cirrosporium novae-zelandiae]|nr:MAG: AAA ATPase [Cirrosporium novae-zelandiae]
MAATILGKRTRASSDIDGRYIQLNLEITKLTDSGSSTITTRSKRRAQIPIYSDGLENPFISRPSQHETITSDPIVIDSVGGPAITPAVTPSKRGRKPKASKTGVSLSPAKINTHLKVTKAISDISRKSIQVVTPQTPRHRDAVSKRVPITPRHRVTVTGNPFGTKTPRTPSTPNSIPTIYGLARQLFVRSTGSGKLVGRDEERAIINEFIQKFSTKAPGGCLYISGPPGTGKSALVEEVCTEWKERGSIKMTSINCMSMKTSRDLSSKLVEDLCGDIEIEEFDNTDVLQNLFVSRRSGAKDKFLVILDEIDHLLTADMEMMYSLFEWSLQPKSRLKLIGIANALDLTDRFLPRLKARNLKPELLPFLPYTASQIASVITTRLRSLLDIETTTDKNFVPFVHPAAIQLCAKKVASQTGDLRKAFDIIRRAIDIVESETKQKHQERISEQVLEASPTKTPLLENMNLSSPSSPSRKLKPTTRPLQYSTLASSLASLTVELAPRATIGHIARISSATFGNGTAQRLQGLNLQQKAALCSLLSSEKQQRVSMANGIANPFTPSKFSKSAPTVKQLFNIYTSLCRTSSALHPLTSTEFRDVISSLETLSLISEVDGKNGSFKISTPSKRVRRGNLFGSVSKDERKVASCVTEKEIMGSLEGVGKELLMGLLKDGESW